MVQTYGGEGTSKEESSGILTSSLFVSLPFMPLSFEIHHEQYLFNKLTCPLKTNKSTMNPNSLLVTIDSLHIPPLCHVLTTIISQMSPENPSTQKDAQKGDVGRLASGGQRTLATSATTYLRKLPTMLGLLLIIGLCCLHGDAMMSRCKMELIHVRIQIRVQTNTQKEQICGNRMYLTANEVVADGCPLVLPHFPAPFIHLAEASSS